jgi:hypothetical protein
MVDPWAVRTGRNVAEMMVDQWEHSAEKVSENHLAVRMVAAKDGLKVTSLVENSAASSVYERVKW